MSAKKRKATSTLGGQGHSFERIVDIAAVRGKRCKICSQVIQEAHTELVHCTNRGCRITKAHAPCVNTIDSSNKCKGNSRMAPALRAFIGGRAMRASTESEQHSPQSKRRDTSRGTTPCDGTCWRMLVCVCVVVCVVVCVSWCVCRGVCVCGARVLGAAD